MRDAPNALAAAVALGDGLEQNQTLTVLNLQGNLIGADQKAELRKLNNDRLTIRL